MEREREIFHLLVPLWPELTGLKLGARNFHVVGEGLQDCLPMPLLGSWIGNGAARTQNRHPYGLLADVAHGRPACMPSRLVFVWKVKVLC